MRAQPDEEDLALMAVLITLTADRHDSLTSEQRRMICTLQVLIYICSCEFWIPVLAISCDPKTHIIDTNLKCSGIFRRTIMAKMQIGREPKKVLHDHERANQPTHHHPRSRRVPSLWVQTASHSHRRCHHYRHIGIYITHLNTLRFVTHYLMSTTRAV